MRKLIKTSRFVVGLISLSFLFGCSSTNFEAKSGTKQQSKISQDAAASPAAPPAPEPPATDQDTNKPASPPTDLGSGSCQPGTQPDYNIMFIFDKTGSQLQTDPGLLRRSGALKFLDQLNTYVTTNPKSTVYSSVLAFNTSSIRASNGWLLVNGTNVATIAQEITVATSDPEGATSYSPVLSDAAVYFDQINPQTNSATVRNYIVFLTDGQPNLDTQGAIDAAVNTLVTKDNVAIIAVAAGPEVTADGEAAVKGLAQPTQPSKFPDHVGQYYRAATEGDFSDVWGKLFTKIDACSNK